MRRNDAKIKLRERRENKTTKTLNGFSDANVTGVVNDKSIFR